MSPVSHFSILLCICFALSTNAQTTTIQSTITVVPIAAAAFEELVAEQTLQVEPVSVVNFTSESNTTATAASLLESDVFTSAGASSSASERPAFSILPFYNTTIPPVPLSFPINVTFPSPVPLATHVPRPVYTNFTKGNQSYPFLNASSASGPTAAFPTGTGTGISLPRPPFATGGIYSNVSIIWSYGSAAGGVATAALPTVLVTAPPLPTVATTLNTIWQTVVITGPILFPTTASETSTASATATATPTSTPSPAPAPWNDWNLPWADFFGDLFGGRQGPPRGEGEGPPRGQGGRPGWSHWGLGSTWWIFGGQNGRGGEGRE